MGDIVVGIDVSLTGTGIVSLYNNRKLRSSQVIISKKDESRNDLERIIFIRDCIRSWFCRILVDNKVKLVVIEGFAFMSKGGKIFERAGLVYSIYLYLYENCIPFLIVAPPSLKKYATGDGRAQKDLVILEVYKKWKVDFSEYKKDANNVADAFVLAQIGFEKLKGKWTKGEVISCLKKFT